MSSDFPPQSFPRRVNPHDERREVFANYGMFGHMYSDSSGKLVFQNVRDDDINAKRYSAIHPVLPLEKTPEKAQYPFQDRVMGQNLSLNAKIKSFLSSIKCMRPRYTRVDSSEFHWVANTHLEVADCLTKNYRDPDHILDGLGLWMKKHLNDYSEILDAKITMFNNSAYTGGCLGHFSSDGGFGYLVSPSGQDFDMLTVRAISEEIEGLLQSKTVAELQLEDPVYEVQCSRVQDQDLLVTRTESEVQVHSFKPERRKEDMLEELCELTPSSGKKICSVRLSPYIPGECLVTTEGECLLWSGEEFVPVYSPAPPKFTVYDQWCGGYFGSHPRQLVYADLTRVDLVDLRAEDPQAVDLFSLPCSDFHKNELVRICDPLHNVAPFHHLIGTDYSMVLIDERFAKHPVLHWDHMLTSPPQYFSTLRQPNSADIVTYIGCQNPVNVHGFKFTISENKSPQSISVPWRAAQMLDLSKWPQFSETCTNPVLLKKRMEASLAGMQAVNYGSDHAVYQMNCHGEIFHQVFKETTGEEDSTFAAGMGSDDLSPHHVALARGTSWIKDWESDMRLNDKGFMMYQTNLLDVFDYMLDTRSTHPECVFCNPGNYTEVSPLDQIEDEERDTKCETCGMHVEQGRQLMDSTIYNTVKAADPDTDSSSLWSHLPELDELPTSDALTKLLCKHWAGDEDIEEVLKQRTMEIREKIKKLKEILSQTDSAAERPEASSVEEREGAATASDNSDSDCGQKAEDSGRDSVFCKQYSGKQRRKRTAIKKNKAKNKKQDKLSKNLSKEITSPSNPSPTQRASKTKKRYKGKNKGKNKEQEKVSENLSKETTSPASLSPTPSVSKTRKRKKLKNKGQNKKQGKLSESLSIETTSPASPPAPQSVASPLRAQNVTSPASPPPSQSVTSPPLEESVTSPASPPRTQRVFKMPFLSPLSRVKSYLETQDSESAYVTSSQTEKQRLESTQSVGSDSVISSLENSVTNEDSLKSGSESDQPVKRRKTLQCTSDSDSSVLSSVSNAPKKRKLLKQKYTYTAGF